MVTFRQYIESDTAVPPEGSSPDSGTHNDSTVGDQEFDISPDERKAADTSQFLTIYKPMSFRTLPYVLSPPIFIEIIKEFQDGSAKIKIRTDLTNKQKIQYKNGGKFEGPLDNKPVYLTKQEMDDVRLSGWDSGNGSGGMPGAPGGAPPLAPPLPGGM
jgi:hypothetical protein